MDHLTEERRGSSDETKAGALESKTAPGNGGARLGDKRKRTICKPDGTIHIEMGSLTARNGFAAVNRRNNSKASRCTKKASTDED